MIKISDAVQKKGYMDLQEVAREDSMPCRYGATLPKDPSCAMPCSWTAADPFSFLIRGDNYLKDHHKVSCSSHCLENMKIKIQNR